MNVVRYHSGSPDRDKDILNFLAFIPPVLLIWWRRQKGEVGSKSDGGEIQPNPQI
jgi:hypothetical protein